MDHGGGTPAPPGRHQGLISAEAKIPHRRAPMCGRIARFGFEAFEIADGFGLCPLGIQPGKHGTQSQQVRHGGGHWCPRTWATSVASRFPVSVTPAFLFAASVRTSPPGHGFFDGKPGGVPAHQPCRRGRDYCGLDSGIQLRDGQPVGVRRLDLSAPGHDAEREQHAMPCPAPLQNTARTSTMPALPNPSSAADSKNPIPPPRSCRASRRGWRSARGGRRIVSSRTLGPAVINRPGGVRDQLTHN